MFSANPLAAGRGRIAAGCATALLMLGVHTAAQAEQPATTLATLLDKSQIQDLIVCCSPTSRSSSTA